MIIQVYHREICVCNLSFILVDCSKLSTIAGNWYKTGGPAVLEKTAGPSLDL